jgi:hypothetical protein
VEVIRRFWHERVVPAWYGFVRVVGDLLDESTFRAVLAFSVIAGRVPLEVERRPWNRSLETPVLVEIRDWTDNRLVFTVLVWPPLESPPETAAYDHRERVRTVKEAIGKGTAAMAWSLPASRPITASGGTTSAKCGRHKTGSPTTARGRTMPRSCSASATTIIGGE